MQIEALNFLKTQLGGQLGIFYGGECGNLNCTRSRPAV